MRGLYGLLVILLIVLVACGPSAQTIPTPTSEVLPYLEVADNILKSIGEAEDTWRSLSLERTRSIASLARDNDPSKIRDAIKAEGKALDVLYSLVGEAVTTFTQITPPEHCQKLHDVVTSSLRLEEKGLRELKAGDWDRGVNLRLEAKHLKVQVNSLLAQCLGSNQLQR